MRHSDPKVTESIYMMADVSTLAREVGRLRFAPHVPAVGHRLAQAAPQAPSSRARQTKRPSDSGEMPASDPGADRTRDLRFRNSSERIEQGVSGRLSSLKQLEEDVSEEPFGSTELLPHGPTVGQGQPERLLMLDEVAHYLCVGMALVERLVTERTLRVVRIGSEVRVRPETLRHFLEAAER